MPAFQVLENTDFGIELTFKDTAGVVVLASAVTELFWELNATKVGASNPVKTATLNPSTNPLVVVVDMSAVDVDAVGTLLLFEARVTYNDSVLGAGTITRLPAVRIRVVPTLLISG